jgi:hypothetical protein
MRKGYTDYVRIPIIFIKPSYSFVTSYNPEPSTRSSSQIHNERNLKDNATNGIISRKSSKAIRLAIDWLVVAAHKDYIWSNTEKKHFPVLLKFITLTLPAPQFHSDEEIKAKCLHQFLVEIVQYHKVKNYVWRAEAQRNGNIHFHITTDKFIHHQDVAEIWNRCINKLGYIDKYRDAQLLFHSEGFKLRPELQKNWNESRQRSAYERGITQNWCSPPTTQIKAVQNIAELSNYLSEEFVKNKSKDYFYSEFRPAVSELDNSRLPQFQELFDTGTCKIEIVPITQGQHKGMEKWSYFTTRRPITGRLWFAGGPICTKKGLSLDLSDGQISQIKKFTSKHPDKVRPVEIPDPMSSTPFTLGNLIFTPIQNFNTPDFDTFTKDVSFFINEIKAGRNPHTKTVAFKTQPVTPLPFSFRCMICIPSSIPKLPETKSKTLFTNTSDLHYSFLLNSHFSYILSEPSKG